VTLSAERQWRSGLRAHATALVLDGVTQRKLASGNAVGLRLSVSHTGSDDANQENASFLAEAQYSLGKPIVGVRVTGSIGLGLRDYPVFFGGAFGDSGREDKTLFGSVNMALPQLETWGFEPVVSIQGRRTTSNVSRFDGSALGIGLQIKSAF
jgi:hypothetical protein